jgi:predicted PurR-regulated permease PerM
MARPDGGRDAAEDRLRRLPADADTGAHPAVTAGQVYRWSAAAAFGILSVAALALAVYSIRSILVLVAIAVFIAVSLDPAVRWLIRLGLRRAVAVSIIFLIAFGLFAAFVLAVTPPLIREGNQLFSNLPGYIERLPEQSSFYRDLDERFQLSERATQFTGKLPERLAGGAVGYVQRVAGAIASALTVIVLTIYVMSDLPRLRRGLVSLFPRARRARVAEVLNVLVEKVGAYMIGNVIVSIIAGVAAFIALAVLGVPYALALAVVVAIADMIPLIGATLGAVVCVAISFFTTDLWPTTIVVIGFFVVYQQLENYLIAPRVMRNTVNISSLAVLLAALIGANVLGLVGALMAIPVAAAVKVVLTPVVAGQDAAAAPAVAQEQPSPEPEESRA